MNKLLPSVKSLITLAALLCFLFQASAASAQKVSLSVRNATVKAAIERLQKDYGYSFVIKTKDADVNKKITLDVKNEEIGAVVGKMFAGQNVVSSVEGKMIAIMSAPAKRDAAARASVNAVVKGVVKDSAGNPITGATVIVDGTTIGATTDLDGSFSVRIGARTDVRLIVSYLGLKTREVAVDDPARFYEVRLENDNMALDEVVVVGYGTQRRSLVTNAISQFKPTEENMRSVMSPSELLQGRIAGVSISTSSGNLGSAEKMSIRGSSSLSASNEPLYVIDGIPLSNNSASLYSFGENMSSLATLNLTDIESIEVLKDAASAAIYGSRATNGVVLITTKQGREGKSEVKVNYGFSITQFPNTGRREYVGSKQYVEVFNEGVDNYNRQNGFTVNSSGYVKPIRNPYGDMPDTDWLDLITRLGQSHYLDLSFSGGNAKTKYYLSGSYNYQEGVIKTNDISKVNLKSNINHEMFKWLKVGANISGNYLHNNRIPGADLGSTIIGRAVQQRPFDRPYKPNGGYYTGGTDELLLHNAVQILSEETSYTDNYRFIGSFWAEAQIIKGLTVRASYNNDSAYTYDYIYYNQNHPYAADKGRILDRNRFVMTNTIDLYANYNRKIGEDFELGAMVGHSFLKTRSRTSYIDAQNYPSPAFDVASVAANIVDASAGLSEYAIESYFARLSLAYKDRYVVNATIRTDGSSRFAPDCRWGWFPSVSVGWNVSNESFWNAEKTDLKIRASYGRNQQLRLAGPDQRRRQLRRPERHRHFVERQRPSDVGDRRPVQRRIRPELPGRQDQHDRRRLPEEHEQPALLEARARHDGRDLDLEQHRVDAQQGCRVHDQHPPQSGQGAVEFVVQHRPQCQQADVAARRRPAVDRRQPCAETRPDGGFVVHLPHGRHLPVRRRGAAGALRQGRARRRRQVLGPQRRREHHGRRPYRHGQPQPQILGRLEQHLQVQRAGIEPLLYVQLRKRRVCVVDDPRLQARLYPLAAESLCRQPLDGTRHVGQIPARDLLVQRMERQELDDVPDRRFVHPPALGDAGIHLPAAAGFENPPQGTPGLCPGRQRLPLLALSRLGPRDERQSRSALLRRG